MKLQVICFAIPIVWISASIWPLAGSEVGPKGRMAALQSVNSTNDSAPGTIPDAKELRKIIALSQEGQWALLGGRWLVIDGQLKNLTLPQALLYPSPVAFFGERTVLLYAHRTDSTTGALALFDVQSGDCKDISLLLEEPHAPAPSPDKRHIAFVSAKGRLQIVDLDSRQTVDLAPAWESTPSWAPDGNLIAFEKNRDRDQGWSFSEVATGSLAPGKITVLDKGRFPSFSPDGERIAYTDVDGKQLLLIAPNGEHRRILKSNLATIRGPLVGPLVWSPNGKKLIFRRIHDSLSGEGHSEAYVLDMKTGAMKRLLQDDVVLGWR